MKIKNPFISLLPIKCARMMESKHRLHHFTTSKILYAILFLIFTNSLNAQSAYLTWDNEVGCQVSENPTRKTYAELIADGECLRVCQGTTVKYSLFESNSSWLSVTWTVNGGQVLYSNADECEVKWNSGTATNASIGAVIHTNGGDITLSTLCIDLIKKPRALFAKAPSDPPSAMEAVGPIEACIDEEIFFSNFSTTNGGSPIIAYHWDFGDCHTSLTTCTSPAFSPSHSYSAGGDYTVTLTVTNACNCTSTYTRTVSVGRKSVAITCPGVVCDGQLATYAIDYGSISDHDCFF